MDLTTVIVFGLPGFMVLLYPVFKFLKPKQRIIFPKKQRRRKAA